VIEDRLRVALGLYRQRGGVAKALVLAGGVAANACVRATVSRFASRAACRWSLPRLGFAPTMAR
jgi:tRNA A37 threonylcarbamoyltransferase TsaD